MLRRLSGQRTGESAFWNLFIAGEGMVQDSAACYAGQRKALCSALQVFTVMRVLKYGGPALRRGKQGAGKGLIVVLLVYLQHTWLDARLTWHKINNKGCRKAALCV